MAKSRKQILQELLDLENEKVETLGEVEEKTEIDAVKNEILNGKNDSIIPVEKVKKPRTQKQMEAFERAKAIRDANALKRKEDAQRLAEELKKKDEEKIVKKAIAIKKKELKKHKILDTISDDDDDTKPVEKKVSVPIPLEKKPVPKEPIDKPVKPQLKINFF